MRKVLGVGRANVVCRMRSGSLSRSRRIVEIYRVQELQQELLGDSDHQFTPMVFLPLKLHTEPQLIYIERFTTRLQLT